MNLLASRILSVDTVSSKLAALLLLTIFMWATGFPWMVPSAKAAAITFFSDTLSDSNLSATSNHTFKFTTTAGLVAGDTIRIDLDPLTNLFTVGALSATDFNSFGGGLQVVNSCTGSTSEATLATTSTSITLTMCSGDTLAPAAIQFKIDNNKITNPGVTSSYVMRLVTTDSGNSFAIRDRGDTRVAILSNVTVTASVDTIFTFTVTGIAANTVINGDATSTATTTTATSIPFGTLLPGIPKVGAQQLTVATNARNGFTVTVQENQNLTSSTGADIDLFKDGATTSAPTAWTSPTNVIDQENTYGHIGVTTEDATLSDGDSFGTALYAGNFDQPREVFYHTGPADGVTPNKGLTKVAYKVEIGTLQEAGNDYTNILTYVATPIF